MQWISFVRPAFDLRPWAFVLLLVGLCACAACFYIAYAYGQKPGDSENGRIPKLEITSWEKFVLSTAGNSTVNDMAQFRPSVEWLNDALGNGGNSPVTHLLYSGKSTVAQKDIGGVKIELRSNSIGGPSNQIEPQVTELVIVRYEDFVKVVNLNSTTGDPEGTNASNSKIWKNISLKKGELIQVVVAVKVDSRKNFESIQNIQ